MLHKRRLLAVGDFWEAHCCCGWRDPTCYEHWEDVIQACRQHYDDLRSKVWHQPATKRSGDQWIASCSCGWADIVAYGYQSLAYKAHREHLGSILLEREKEKVIKSAHEKISDCIGEFHVVECSCGWWDREVYSHIGGAQESYATHVRLAALEEWRARHETPDAR